MNRCEVPNQCAPLLISGTDKKSSNEWCRITKVGAPESNQPVAYKVIFKNSHACHCSVFIHTLVPEPSKFLKCNFEVSGEKLISVKIIE